MMKIKLTKLRPDIIKGIYNIDGVEGRMPARSLYLEPKAAVSFLANGLDKVLTVSDLYRSAESSLAAVRSGRGAMPPGFSAHNYGIAVDVDVRKSMKAMGFSTKGSMDLQMEKFGWFCHRRDHQITNLQGESHHYTFLGVGAVISPKVETIVNYTELEIQRLYGEHFNMEAEEIQRCLASLKLYSGEIDGKIGPLSKEAIKLFQRQWGIQKVDGDYLKDPDGRADKRTMRTLAFVSAEKEVVP